MMVKKIEMKWKASRIVNIYSYIAGIIVFLSYCAIFAGIQWIIMEKYEKT